MLRLAHAHDDGLDPTVVAAAQRGEPSAQSAVVRRYGGPVWSCVCRILGRASATIGAEDVVQDALVAVLGALPRASYQGPAQLTKWVLTIAARTAIDALRRQRGPRVPVTDEVDALAAEDPDAGPEQTAERRALGRAIAAAVEELGPEIRAAFVLRAYHEFDYAEIAEALAIDLGTVKSRLWRARAALARRLREVHRG
jgi:RNA polymerase sigma-70 factor, ECF subfamily